MPTMYVNLFRLRHCTLSQATLANWAHVYPNLSSVKRVIRKQVCVVNGWQSHNASGQCVQCSSSTVAISKNRCSKKLLEQAPASFEGRCNKQMQLVPAECYYYCQKEAWAAPTFHPGPIESPDPCIRCPPFIICTCGDQSVARDKLQAHNLLGSLTMIQTYFMRIMQMLCTTS